MRSNVRQEKKIVCCHKITIKRRNFAGITDTTVLCSMPCKHSTKVYRFLCVCVCSFFGKQWQFFSFSLFFALMLRIRKMTWTMANTGSLPHNSWLRWHVYVECGRTGLEWRWQRMLTLFMKMNSKNLLAPHNLIFIVAGDGVNRRMWNVTEFWMGLHGNFFGTRKFELFLSIS